jgi:hypothetical protein
VSQDDARLIREHHGSYPIFERVFQETQREVRAAIARPIDVPQPKDAAGYTHDRHKRNGADMRNAGLFYQITGDSSYAIYAREMLLKYAQLYPTLGKHPATLKDGGRLFWQTLNETVWLIDAAQAYDYVHDWLSPADRTTIEDNLLRPIAKFFIEENNSTMNRIHNHGTWMVASVGMLGYALGDKNLVDIALYGTKKDGKSGFLRQMDLLFSPDGYYTEGAYYARYVLKPFFVFAQAIENNQPELKIFERRDQILRKALWAVFQLSYTDGTLIPINDAIKGKNISAEELVLALDIAYQRYGGDRRLLPLASKQHSVSLDGAGLRVAQALAATGVVPDLQFGSIELRDGANGDEGAVGILRSGSPNDQSMLVMKYTAQGLGHGHYDRLGMLYNHQGKEVIQDYGAARFVNVDPKFGGRYLPENESFAKQTIGHNTIVVDVQSHFGGKYDKAKEQPAERHFFDARDTMIQVMSAKINKAYPGVKIQRTMAMIRDERFEHPVVLDLFKVDSKEKHQYDIPYYYIGQHIATNVALKTFNDVRKPLGSAAGYQHLWKEAEARSDSSISFTWLNGIRYYSLISDASPSAEIVFARIGANDPNFNLRNDPVVIFRRFAESTVIATLLEPHGGFDLNNERSTGAYPQFEKVVVTTTTDALVVADLYGISGLHWTFAVTTGEPNDTSLHSCLIDGKKEEWSGNFKLWKH